MATQVKKPRMDRSNKILNICKGFDYNKISLHPIAVRENNGSFSYDWVYQEDENDKKHNVQLFFDPLMILYGFNLGFSEEKDGKKVKEEWERGYVFEIQCPHGKLRYNKEKDCYEGSPVQKINVLFNNAHRLHERMKHCMSTTRNQDNEIIFPDLGRYEHPMILLNKKNGSPFIRIKLNGKSDKNTKKWTCSTRMFKGNTEDLYTNSTEMVLNHCYKFVASFNVDLTAFVKCAKSTNRLNCFSMSIYYPGTSIKPVFRPDQPDAEAFNPAEFGLDVQPEQHDQLDDETLAQAAAAAEAKGAEKASVEFNARSHNQDAEEQSMQKRARHEDDEPENNDNGGDDNCGVNEYGGDDDQ